MKKKILLTGSCGFIGSNFILQNVHSKQAYSFASVDKILAPYNLANINRSHGHEFYMGDMADEQFMNNVFMLEKPDIVIHMGAESFVDDSIASAKPFIHSNVVGTQNMVDLSVKYNVEKFIYISTDEVYGQLQKNDASWTEKSITNPRNPYSASKLAGELIVRAAGETHGLKYNITRCSNNYGKIQPPRNLIPKVITCLLNDNPIPIHGDGKNIREWIHCSDHCSAIITILEYGKLNETYNIGSGFELSNIEVVDCIANTMKMKPEIKFIADRKGHDKRYAINCSKLKQLGWAPKIDFNDGIKMAIEWYIEHPNFYNIK